MVDRNKKPSLKEITYYVKGMHCSSCELIIEKGLLKGKGIEAVEASLGKEQVSIYYEGEKPAISELNKQFQKEGYTFFEKQVKEGKRVPLFSFDEGGLMINKVLFFRYLQIFGIALLLLFGFIFLNQTGIASRVVVSSISPLPAFFLFGLIAGISSCAALVGGIVLSMSKQWAEIFEHGTPNLIRFQPHLLFNLGRLVSFAVLGAFLGAIGSLFRVSLMGTSLLAIGVSVMMVLLALQMLGIRRFQRFQIIMPKSISRFVADERNLKGRYMPFTIGALTFFLPCGFAITAQGLALASGSSVRGMLILFFFALGTLPMLVTIGFSSLKLTTKPHLSEKFLKVAGILVLFFGLYTFNSQLNVLGLPSLNDFRPSLLGTQIRTDGLIPVINGKQVLKMDALAYGYEPNEFKIRAGVPARWEITNKGVSGCTNAIVSKGLFSGQIDLNQELAVKEFIPQKPGRYKFSCWMGMISGVIEVVDESGSAREVIIPSGEEIPSGARGCSCGGGCGGGCGRPNCPYVR